MFLVLTSPNFFFSELAHQITSIRNTVHDSKCSRQKNLPKKKTLFSGLIYTKKKGFFILTFVFFQLTHKALLVFVTANHLHEDIQQLIAYVATIRGEKAFSLFMAHKILNSLAWIEEQPSYNWKNNNKQVLSIEGIKIRLFQWLSRNSWENCGHIFQPLGLLSPHLWNYTSVNNSAMAGAHSFFFFCMLIFMRLVESTKRLTKKEVSWLPAEQIGRCVVCTNGNKLKRLSLFTLFKESWHSTLIKRWIWNQSIRLCVNVKGFYKLQIENHTLTTGEANFGTAINGYICRPVCKLCEKHSKSKLKDTRFNCSVSFQLFYQWWAVCLLTKNTSACQVMEQHPR